MLKSKYVNFQEAGMSNTAMPAGCLSFLPFQHHYRIKDKVHAIYMEMDEFVLLEIKGDIDVLDFRLDLYMREVSFWQLYQFMSSSLLYLPHSLPVSDNRCISFSSSGQKVPLLLKDAKQWIVLIGYRRNYIDQLLKEFPVLSTLVYGEGADAKGAYWEPDISINHSLRDAWARIGGSTYLPLRGKAELLLSICRLQDEYCQQLDRQANQSERTRLGLYHKALAYINDNVLDSISKEMVVKGLGVNSRTLERAFEGRPFKIAEYIQRMKLNQAKNLLYQGEMTVDQVSNLLNYPNRKYFSKEFKKYFFQTPSSFQKEMETFRERDEERE